VDILEIPAGATNIQIKEETSSRSYLGIRPEII
jgi:hypothetical protein